MNIERILQLADFIEKLSPERFDISLWIKAPDRFLTNQQLIHDCGTCACIGGWAQMLFNDPYEDSISHSQHAFELLGLTELQADKLFCPPNYSEPSLYPQDRVVRTLRRLAKTGEILWD